MKMAYKIKRKKPKKLSTRKLNYFIKDEKEASKEYAKYGFKKLSEDEKKHQKFFEKLKEKRKKEKPKKKPEKFDEIALVYDVGISFL
jgi:hypothetical protein